MFGKVKKAKNERDTRIVLSTQKDIDAYEKQRQEVEKMLEEELENYAELLKGSGMLKMFKAGGSKSEKVDKDVIRKRKGAPVGKADYDYNGFKR